MIFIMANKRSIIWKAPLAELSDLVKNARSYKEILSFYGIKNIGGNPLTLKNRLEADGIDHSHLKLGQSLPKGHGVQKQIPLANILVENSS
jgi:hypothetical protein